jgi:hypothetical protein
LYEPPTWLNLHRLLTPAPAKLMALKPVMLELPKADYRLPQIESCCVPAYWGTLRPLQRGDLTSAAAMYRTPRPQAGADAAQQVPLKCGRNPHRILLLYRRYHGR